MVNNSPKNNKGGNQASIVDALEDDLVKKYENEKIEKEKSKITTATTVPAQ
jgi:hypothetical protein